MLFRSYKEYSYKFKNLISHKEIKKFLNLGFVMEPIIKINDKTWSRVLTDKYLLDKGYGWICYIKLFQGKPFICGKTGTRLVSKSEIDFDFLVGTENDITRSGIGRRYIRESYPDVKYTDFDYVLIKGCKSEEEALKLEEKIQVKYNLFSS